MLSMFKEKDCDGKETTCWSMTRVVAFVSAMTLNFIMLTLGRNNHVHDIAWPFCVMYVVVLLAVPIQAMFKMVQEWLRTGPGQRVLKRLIAKIEATSLSVVGSSPSPTVVETKVTQGDTNVGT